MKIPGKAKGREHRCKALRNKGNRREISQIKQTGGGEVEEGKTGRAYKVWNNKQGVCPPVGSRKLQRILSKY